MLIRLTDGYLCKLSNIYYTRFCCMYMCVYLPNCRLRTYLKYIKGLFILNIFAYYIRCHLWGIKYLWESVWSDFWYSIMSFLLDYEIELSTWWYCHTPCCFISQWDFKSIRFHNAVFKSFINSNCNCHK